MKALIIDDHKINRLYLKTILEESFPSIKRIDEVGTVSAAIRSLEIINYDLIFLDMELRDGMGFDVLKEIKDFVYVIVVTSHKEYAIQAIKHNVVDYILKPIDQDEVKNAVNKVVKLLEKEQVIKNSASNSEALRVKNEMESSFMINFKGQCVTIEKKDILYIKALGKYSEIHLSAKSPYTSYKNLKEFEIVMTDTFVRLHHSYLVNLKCIVSYSRETCHVELSSGDQIPVSVRKREDLFKKFKVF